MREKLYSKHGMLVTLAVMLLTLFGGNVNAQTLTSLVMQNAAETKDVTEKINLLAAESVEKIIHDYYIVATLENGSSVGVMTWELNNKATGEAVKSRSTEKPNVDGTFTFWIPGVVDTELTLGVEYELILTGWESADAKNHGDPNFTKSVIIKGATNAYVYSPVTLVEPAELLYSQGEANFSLQSAEDNTISFTFSDAVTIEEASAVEGMGSKIACSVAMSEDNKTATITIPDAIMSQYYNFVVSILAKDANGLVVKGNNGEKDDSYISVYVDAKFNLAEITMNDPAPESTVEKISTIKFGYEGGIGDSYSGKKITILDKARNVVATSTDIQQIIPESEQDNWNYEPVEVLVTFNKEVTTSGVYTIMVPEGVFNTGNQFSQKNNKETIFTLYVDNDSPMPQLNVSIDPVPGEVASLNKFDLIFNDADEAGWGNGYPTLTYPDGTVVKIKNQDIGTEWNELLLSLDEVITAPGEYILTLPTASVVLDGTPTAQDYSFTYTIVAAGNNDVTLDPAPGIVTEIPASIKVVFNNESGINPGNGEPYITDAKGKTYAATLAINWDWPEWNALELTLTEGAITADGIYTLTFPAGCVTLANGDPTPVDYTFVYTIGDPTAISKIFANEKNVEVYDAAGVRVKSGDASVINSLAPNKLYIINGKKYIIRK